MAKNTKSAAQKAAEQQAPNAETNQEPQVTHEDLIKNPKLMRGLSQDSKVMLAFLTHDRYIKNPRKEYPEYFIEGADVMTDALIADTFVTEIVSGGSVVSAIIARDEKKYNAIAKMLICNGIKMPEFKALPAPTAEQLQKNGITMLPAESAVVVTVKPEDVPQETQKQKKKELDLAKKKLDLDPTKIETREELKDSLEYIFIHGVEALDVKVQKAIDFYNSYLTVKATKSDNKEEELKNVKKMTRAAQLDEISKIIGPCPLMPKGLGYFLYGAVLQTGSVVPAFCLYRRSAITTGKSKDVDDSFIADIVRILINWYGTGEIEKFTKLNNNNERTLKKLKEDAKGNVKTIRATETSMRYNDEQINSINSVLDKVNNPSFDACDLVLENYNAEDKESDDFKLAHRLVRNVADTYYKDVEIDDVEEKSLLNNIAQRIGVITNMFRDPLSRNINYSETNITELVMKPEQPAAEGEESKN